MHQTPSMNTSIEDQQSASFLLSLRTCQQEVMGRGHLVRTHTSVRFTDVLSTCMYHWQIHHDGSTLHVLLHPSGLFCLRAYPTVHLRDCQTTKAIYVWPYPCRTVPTTSDQHYPRQQPLYGLPTHKQAECRGVKCCLDF